MRRGRLTQLTQTKSIRRNRSRKRANIARRDKGDDGERRKTKGGEGSSKGMGIEFSFINERNEMEWMAMQFVGTQLQSHT